MVLSIIAALLVLTIFIVIHEMGHFAVGRLLGFEILEFAVGMGPKIVSVEKKGIIYSLRAFPIGGMCRFYGEDEEPRDALAFGAQKVWKRVLVVLTGPLMNLLFAVLLAAVILMTYGDFVPEIAEFSGEGTPAEAAGILPGDILVKVDGKRITYFNQTTALIQRANSESCEVVVERGGELIKLTVKDFYNQETGGNLMGIMIQASRKVYGFFESLAFSVSYVWSIISETLSYLGGLIVGTVELQSGDVAGPVGIVALLSEAVRSGLEVVLRFGVMISASLGLMNLLPLPALDGGRLVFMGLEAVRGKPVSQKVEGAVHLVGMVLLFGLVIFLSIKDVAGLVGG